MKFNENHTAWRLMLAWLIACALFGLCFAQTMSPVQSELSTNTHWYGLQINATNASIKIDLVSTNYFVIVTGSNVVQKISLSNSAPVSISMKAVAP